MKAICQDRYGDADILELTEVDTPVARADEVLVRVHAAAVNAYDWHFMRGDPYVARMSMGLRGPKQKIRGKDFAGQVEAVGRDVQGVRPGDEVFGMADGAFAQYVCAPAALVSTKPASLTFEQAAAVPLAGLTALIGLRDAGRVGPGQQVLINGASGGVGTFAVQIAASLGAHVTGVCSTRNVDLVRSLGADAVVDYTREDFTTAERRYDVVFDLVGNRSLPELRRVLKPKGTLVLSGGGVSAGGSLLGPIRLMLRAALLARFARHRIVILTIKPVKADLATLRDLVESGQLTPAVDRTYPLSEAAEAIRYLELEHARAKVVIAV